MMVQFILQVLEALGIMFPRVGSFTPLPTASISSVGQYVTNFAVNFSLGSLQTFSVITVEILVDDVSVHSYGIGPYYTTADLTGLGIAAGTYAKDAVVKIRLTRGEEVTTSSGFTATYDLFDPTGQDAYDLNNVWMSNVSEYEANATFTLPYGTDSNYSDAYYDKIALWRIDTDPFYTNSTEVLSVPLSELADAETTISSWLLTPKLGLFGIEGVIGIRYRVAGYTGSYVYADSYIFTGT